MSLFLLVHVVISLVGILTGFVVVYGLLTAQPLKGWTALYLATTVLTSVTGFFLPAKMLLPSHIVGILSLVVLVVALYALYGKHLSGAWRWVYVVTAVTAFYFNFFVLIVQSFLKIPALHELAPTQKEPPFAIAQGVALIAFIVFGFLGVKKFRVSAGA
jgi:hypothetical protein